MMKIERVLFVLIASASAAPQFQFSDGQVMPYEFAYGVSDESTGDVKEHKESVSPSGRTEGEYRWLQPNGLYRVTRYFVDGDGGYQATVSEEPGEQVSNYYFNTVGNVGSSSSSQQAFSSLQSTSSGAAFSGSQFSRNQQAFGTSQFSRNQQSFGNSQSSGNQGTFANSQFSRNQQSFGNSQSSGNSQFSTNQQFFGNSQSSLNQNQAFTTTQTFQNQQNSQGGDFIASNIIDGGVINGGVIDGGFIDGGIINGGSLGGTNAFANSNSFSQGLTTFQTSVPDNTNINRGVAVILAGTSVRDSLRG
ncbi:uncharacterized PPE family protein PPE12-like [Penaeus japonicus]|uniref:uncharacterized PPE family protein PPE12-like n=1 Tax=Penaeus japonicus TaxID=27405 RepID=UPI001C714C13|nr:uncharacterized PPE family protein PPE12-like [Penaeus japonicus]